MPRISVLGTGLEGLGVEGVGGLGGFGGLGVWGAFKMPELMSIFGPSCCGFPGFCPLQAGAQAIAENIVRVFAFEQPKPPLCLPFASENPAQKGYRSPQNRNLSRSGKSDTRRLIQTLQMNSRAFPPPLQLGTPPTNRPGVHPSGTTILLARLATLS